MSGLYGMSVTFRYEDDDFDVEKLRAIAQGAKRKFVGMPGLRLKSFTIDVARRKAVNHYVWESEQLARAFLDEAQIARITEVYGVRPVVHFVEISALVENH